MQQHMVIKAMLGGLLGTLGQILLVYGVVPLMAGHALDLAALRDLPCRMVKKLMRLRAHSISAAPQAVRDTVLGLRGLELG